MSLRISYFLYFDCLVKAYDVLKNKNPLFIYGVKPTIVQLMYI